MGSNTPNPFALTTRISYRIPTDTIDSDTVLRIYDPAGRLIRTLVDAHKPEGHYSVTWDGTDRAGSLVAPGVYFYQLDWNSRQLTRRIVLIR